MSEAKVLETPTLNESESLLRKELYGRNENSTYRNNEPVVPVGPLPSLPLKSAKPKVKPTHYKVVCISLYTQDIENLEAKVAELKRRGHTKANKSQLIRQALRMLDIDKLPPPQQ